MATKGSIPTPELFDRIVGATETVERMPQHQVDPHSQPPARQYPEQNIIFQNQSGETVPPYGAMEVTDVVDFAGRNLLKIRKPTGDTNVMIVFNNHTEVQDGKNGVCHINGVIRALYSNGDGSNGTDYVTKADSWELETGSGGFQAFGTVPDTDDQMFVTKNSGGGKARWIIFSLDSALTTTNATATVTVETYIDGSDPDPDSDGVTVRNQDRTETGSNYMFEGDAGNIGQAYYDPDEDEYQILQLWNECD